MILFVEKKKKIYLSLVTFSTRFFSYFLVQKDDRFSDKKEITCFSLQVSHISEEDLRLSFLHNLPIKINCYKLNLLKLNLLIIMNLAVICYSSYFQSSVKASF